MQMQNRGLIIVRLRIKPEMTLELVSGSSRAVTLGSSIFLFFVPVSVSPKHPPEDAASPKLSTLRLAGETRSLLPCSPGPAVKSPQPQARQSVAMGTESQGVTIVRVGVLESLPIHPQDSLPGL